MRFFFSNILITATISLLFFSCTRNMKYINGVMSTDEYSGAKAYLYTLLPERKLVDSVEIDGVVFGFDVPDTLNIYNVIVKKGNNDMFPIVLPLVSGEGKVNIYMGDKVVTCGTPTNDRLQDFLLALDAFNETSINSSRNSEEILNDFKEFLVQQVKVNKDNIVSVYIIREFRSRFAPEVYEELVAALDDSLRPLIN